MAKSKRLQKTRERLLDEAEGLVEREGVLALTFDQLAARAGVAKGTVLYHFDCKEALISAMIERFVERFDAAWTDRCRSDPNPRGRKTRAYITATHRGEPFTGQHFDDVNGAITAALANSPERLQAVQAQGQRHQQAIENDEIDPVLATIIRMAIDGLWFAESFKLMRYDPALKAAVVDRLMGWTHGQAAEAQAVSSDDRTTIDGRTK